MKTDAESLTPLAHSVPESARLVRVSERTIHRLIDSGELESVKVGRRRLIPRDALERLCHPSEAAA